MNFFKPPPKPTSAAVPVRHTSSALRPSPAKPVRQAPPPSPPPLPEVTEGNEDSDWAMWEDSVAFQDSQMPSVFNDLSAVKTRDEAPKKIEGTPADPYAAVRKRGA